MGNDVKTVEKSIESPTNPPSFTEDNIVETGKGTWGYRLEVYNSNNKFKEGGGALSVVGYPTRNCQMCSIANIQAITHLHDFKEILKLLLRPSNNKRSIKMCLIDFHARYEKKILEVIPGAAIKIRAPYVSTNRGTPMVLIVFDTEFLSKI